MRHEELDVLLCSQSKLEVPSKKIEEYICMNSVEHKKNIYPVSLVRQIM